MEVSSQMSVNLVFLGSSKDFCFGSNWKGQTMVNIGCWLIRASIGLEPCYGVADVNLNELGLNLILFPYLASKLPVTVVTKKESRLDQREEGQGIVFSVSYLWPGVFGHKQSTSAISNSQGVTARIRDNESSRYPTYLENARNPQNLIGRANLNYGLFRNIF